MISLCTNKARFFFLSSKPITDVRRSRIIHWVRSHSSNFLSGKHVDSSFLPASTCANQLCDMQDAHSYPWLDCLLKQTFADEGIITVGFSFDLSANSQSLCRWYYCSWRLSQTFISDMEFSWRIIKTHVVRQNIYIHHHQDFKWHIFVSHQKWRSL